MPERPGDKRKLGDEKWKMRSISIENVKRARPEPSLIFFTKNRLTPCSNPDVVEIDVKLRLHSKAHCTGTSSSGEKEFVTCFIVCLSIADLWTRKE